MNLMGSAIACVFVLSWPSVCLPLSLPAGAPDVCAIYVLLATVSQVGPPRKNRRASQSQESDPDNDPIGA
jgi:hypothetical protein